MQVEVIFNITRACACVHLLMYCTLYNYMYTHLRSIGDDKVGGIDGVNECPSQVDCTPARVSHLLLCPVSVCVCVSACGG